ncbi:MAG: LamG domain-containing protein [Agrococcus sp.]
MNTNQHISPSNGARVMALAAALLLTASGCAPAAPVGAASEGWTFLTADADASVTLEGGAELTDGVLVLDGLTGFATAPAPPEFDTRESFTVSTWVALGGEAPFVNAVSQIGEVAGSFFLGVAEGSYAFSMKDADTNSGDHTVRALGAAAVVDPERWVHLAGTFDASAGTIALYVDGVEAAVTPFAAPIRVDGDLVLGGAQAHAQPSDFWPGPVTAVRIAPGSSDTGGVIDEMEATRPTIAPPVAAGPDPASYGDGVLDGTWDYVYTPDELAFLADAFLPEEKAELGELTAARLGFDGPEWWQGFIGDGELWLVNGVPEGDGGVFTIDGETLTMGDDTNGATYDWSLDGDGLTLALVECRADGSPCADVEMVRFMTERTWTRTSTDPSY